MYRSLTRLYSRVLPGSSHRHYGKTYTFTSAFDLYEPRCTTVEINQWLVKNGDTVKANDGIVKLELHHEMLGSLPFVITSTSDGVVTIPPNTSGIIDKNQTLFVINNEPTGP